MPRDYANRAAGRGTSPKRSAAAGRRASSRAPRKSSRSKPQAPATVAFSAPSFAAGVLVGGAMVLSLPYLSEFLEAPAETARPASAVEQPQVTFIFDDLLSSSVVTTDPDAYPVEFEDPSAEAPSTFLLQAASFESFAEAADLQARLADQDLPAAVSRVTVNDRPWYRVTVGPFSRQIEAQRAMTRLRENNLAPLPLKRG